MKYYNLLFVTAFVASLLVGCEVSNDTVMKISREKGSAEALSIARQNGCMNCHNVTNSIVGPAWDLVSERYKDSPDARAYLINKVKKGGGGAWSDITGGAKMPPHESRVSHAHIAQIVDFIISLKADSAAK